MGYIGTDKLIKFKKENKIKLIKHMIKCSQVQLPEHIRYIGTIWRADYQIEGSS